MPLSVTIIKKVRSDTSLNRRYPSPPPEFEELDLPRKREKKWPQDKYAHVRPAVDTSPPRLDPRGMYRRLPGYRATLTRVNFENMKLLKNIKDIHFFRGKVDSRWTKYPERSLLAFKNRQNLYKRIMRDNKELHRRIQNAEVKVTRTAVLRREWKHNRQQIIQLSQAKFVLFPPVPRETMEDHAFAAPVGVKRPRIHLTLGIQGCAAMGEVVVELFTDVCPATCALFAELADGDGVGYGYIGTSFFRKVPGLFWSGGDVVYDNGFGCYAQRGRRVPIGAENYHFSHSMPGLLSMRVTKDDEMCGIFNITFKAMPQFDLRNVVFGRIIRPCDTFAAMQCMGTALSSRPLVAVQGARRWTARGWVTGVRNTRIYNERLLRRQAAL